MVQVILSKSVSQEEQGKKPQPMVQIIQSKSVSLEEQGRRVSMHLFHVSRLLNIPLSNSTAVSPFNATLIMSVSATSCHVIPLCHIIDAFKRHGIHSQQNIYLERFLLY